VWYCTCWPKWDVARNVVSFCVSLFLSLSVCYGHTGWCAKTTQAIQMSFRGLNYGSREPCISWGVKSDRTNPFVVVRVTIRRCGLLQNYFGYLITVNCCSLVILLRYWCVSDFVRTSMRLWYLVRCRVRIPGVVYDYAKLVVAGHIVEGTGEFVFLILVRVMWWFCESADELTISGCTVFVKPCLYDDNMVIMPLNVHITCDIFRSVELHVWQLTC